MSAPEAEAYGIVRCQDCGAHQARQVWQCERDCCWMIDDKPCMWCRGDVLADSAWALYDTLPEAARVAARLNATEQDPGAAINGEAEAVR